MLVSGSRSFGLASLRYQEIFPLRVPTTGHLGCCGISVAKKAFGNRNRGVGRGVESRILKMGSKGGSLMT